MDQFEFEGKTINITVFFEKDFQEACAQSGIEILKTEDMEYPWINTDLSKSTLTKYEYVSKKTGQKCFAYENTFATIEDFTSVIFTCDQEVKDIKGMLKKYDSL